MEEAACGIGVLYSLYIRSDAVDTPFPTVIHLRLISYHTPLRAPFSIRALPPSGRPRYPSIPIPV